MTIIVEFPNRRMKNINNPLNIEHYSGTKLKSLNKWYGWPKNQNKIHAKH